MPTLPNFEQVICHCFLGFFILVIAVGAVIAIAFKIYRNRANLEIEFQFSFVAGPAITIKKTNLSSQLAHKIWAQLATRKLALSFDKDQDLITEVYDSWYAAFSTIRNVISEIPAHKIRRDKDTQALMELAVNILNQGLRPHLTRWQSHFRWWFAKQQTANPEKTMLEVQEAYPDLEALLEDLEKVNSNMKVFLEKLKKLAH